MMIWATLKRPQRLLISLEDLRLDGDVERWSAFGDDQLGIAGWPRRSSPLSMPPES
jgi:hypothetical protein